MKQIFLILAIIAIVISCKQKQTEVIKNSYHTKNIVNTEESENLIENSQEFELKYNEIFQKDLQIKSKEYYNNVIETFIDEETGFFKLFGELWDSPFKSENERKTLWKLKIERYFRTTAYLAYIRKEVTIYTDGVNNQRENGISKILNVKYSSNLNLPIIESNSFNTKNETVENIITKINTEIIEQLADAVLGFSPEIIVGILVFFGACKGIKIHLSIPIVFGACLAIFFWIRSHNRQNEIREILKTECNKTINSTKIDYLDLLNKNTIDYYSQLQKINYETN
ncbi:hypothetical protein [Flavobacterium sp. WC2509]|uniref:hypothetical protein n=1 Tax=Flavobacterium sp. WC2509 TaxID=3461406 RepID=UPI004044FFD0